MIGWTHRKKWGGTWGSCPIQWSEMFSALWLSWTKWRKDPGISIFRGKKFQLKRRSEYRDQALQFIIGGTIGRHRGSSFSDGDENCPDSLWAPIPRVPQNSKSAQSVAGHSQMCLTLSNTHSTQQDGDRLQLEETFRPTLSKGGPETRSRWLQHNQGCTATGGAIF